MKIIARRLIRLLIPLCFFAIGCSDEKVDSKFGYTYSIMTNPPPTVHNDTLFVRVGWSGCSNDHEFQLRSAARGGASIDVWLFKLTPDQVCDAYLEKDLTLKSTELAIMENVILIAPDHTNFDVK